MAGYSYWSSSVLSRIGYETNRALRVNDPVGSSSAQVRANINVGYRLEDRWVEAGADLASTRYPGDSDQSSDDFGLSLRGGLEFEHGVAGLNLRAVHDSSLSSEAGPGGTGLVSVRVPRSAFTLAPFWRRELNEDTAVSASYRFQAVRFDEDADTPLADSDAHGLQFGLQRTLDERTQFQLTLQADRLVAYDTPRARRQQTSNLAGFAGISHAFSERATLGVDIGLARLRSDYSDVVLIGPSPFGFGLVQYRNPVTGEVLVGPAGATPGRVDSSIEPDVGLRYVARLDLEGERWQAGFSVGRIGTPLSTGDVAVDDTLSGTLRWDMSERERLETSLDLSRRTEDSTGLAASGGREYVAFGIGYVRELSEQLSFAAAYDFVQQSFDSGGGTARSHGVFATFTYRWDARPL